MERIDEIRTESMASL
ncbi:Protein of unknown function [Bacillus cytotoxicus]|uniref:Uncharacterized protein n=1 Tax=Bacillus cytotoxicus TaxID=580165 RepID=A0AAX2CH92_9BACI|nr:Protein of unknown function [Bacillus cytotoxicus]